MKSSGLSDEQADMILNSLHGRNVTQERKELNQLERVYQALLRYGINLIFFRNCTCFVSKCNVFNYYFISVSFPTVNKLCDSFDEEKSDQLKKFIYDYFHESSENVQASTDAFNAEVSTYILMNFIIKNEEENP